MRRASNSEFGTLSESDKRKQGSGSGLVFAIAGETEHVVLIS